MSILVIGSANTDLIIQVENIPRPGETVLGGTFLTASGGKGANQAVAAARLGGRVRFIASISQDAFGKQLMQQYQQDDIDTSLIKHPDGPSGIAMIYVARNGQNSISVAPGSNALLNCQDIQTHANVFKDSRIVLTQLETPIETIHEAAKQAKNNDCIFILNPAPATKLPEDIYSLIDLITPNETEAQMLTGIPVTDIESAQKAAQSLYDKGVKTIIITLGEQGVYLFNKHHNCHIPTIKVKAVDTTAAGDTFNGALAYALSQEDSLISAIKFANQAASLSVTKLGAQTSIPSKEEIKTLASEA